MDTILQLLLVGLYSIAEPLRLIGYAAAGAVARRPLQALGLGAAWAVIVTVGGLVLRTNFQFEPIWTEIQVIAGAVAALVIHLIARALRR